MKICKICGREYEEIEKEHSGAISKESAKNLINLAKMNGYTKDEVYEIILTLGYTKVVDILKQDYTTLVKEFEIKAEDWRARKREIEEENWGEEYG